MHAKGYLIVVTGPMFATKSQTARAIYEKYCVFDKGIWFKPNTDSRCDGKTVTHDNRVIVDATTIPATQPEVAITLAKNFKIVSFDEAQFFSENITSVVTTLLNENKIIIINGLKLTAKGDIFGSMHKLLCYADEIISLKSVCNLCKKVDSATRTRAFEKNAPLIKIGGLNDYFVVCPECDHGIEHNLSSSF